MRFYMFYGILSLILLNVFFYFIGCFNAYSFNIKEWSDFSRFLISMLSLFSVFVFGLIVVDLIQKNKK